MNNTLNDLPLATVRPSATNPRKDFTSPGAVAYLHELALTIRQKGVLQPILVRPDYCVGATSHAIIEERRRPLVDWYDIIAGDCRHRASGYAERETIPAIVTEMTDDDAREAQQIENLQRRDLSPLEEADGVVAMLELKNDDGSPRYTVMSLAEKLGHEAAWVYQRKAFKALPEIAKKAIGAGVLSPKVARLIMPIPTAAVREEFTQKILKPDLSPGPLSYTAAKELREDYMKVLKGAPFDLDDAALLPDAGPCASCPKMSANCMDLFDRDENIHLRGRTCLDPACFRSKVAALTQRQITEAAKAGKIMLTADQAEHVYPFFAAAGEMDPKSPYVQLGRKPAEFLLKNEVTKVPTWERLVEDAEEKTGAKVPRVLIADQDGVVREHVDLKLAIAAIEKAGEPIFRTDGAREPKAADSTAIERKAEAERSKARWAVAKATLDAMWAELRNGWDKSAVWDALFYIAMTHAGEDGLLSLAKWQGLPLDEGDFGAADAVEKWWNGLGTAERDAVIPLLLVAHTIKHQGAEAADFSNLAKALKVDIDAVAKKALVDFKAKESGARLKPAELEAKVRELHRAKQSPAGIAVALGLSLKKLDRILVKIEKEEAAAKIDAKPETGKKASTEQKGGKKGEKSAKQGDLFADGFFAEYVTDSHTRVTVSGALLCELHGPQKLHKPAIDALRKGEKPDEAFEQRYQIEVVGAQKDPGAVTEGKYLAAKTKMIAGSLWPDVVANLGLTPAQATAVYKRFREEEAAEAADGVAETKKELNLRQQVQVALVAGEPNSDICKRLQISLPKLHTIRKALKAEVAETNASISGATAPAKAAKPAKVAKAKPAKPTAEEIEADVRKRRAKGEGFTDIFIATKVPRRKLKALLAKIDSEKKGGAK